MYEIKVKIHQESDLYNPLDPDQSELSDTVTSYVVRKYQEKNHEEPVCLHVISDLPVDEERIRENFRIHMERQLHIEHREHQIATVKQIRLFLIGIAFIAIWLIAASKTENILVEVLSIIGSFAVWEAANIFIAEKPYIRMKSLILSMLSKTKIRFTVLQNQETN